MNNPQYEGKCKWCKKPIRRSLTSLRYKWYHTGMVGFWCYKDGKRHAPSPVVIEGEKDGS